jgi:hypothetical protein
MGGDVTSLAAEIMPYMSAACGTYGRAVLAKAQDDIASATVQLGHRLPRKAFGRLGEWEPLPRPLADLAADTGDPDALAAVQLAVRKALAANPVLAGEVRSMLVGAPGVSQQVWAQRDAYTAGRDQVVVHYREPAND